MKFKKTSKTVIVIWVLLVLFWIYTIVNLVTEQKNLTLSNDTLDKIAYINWSDNQELESVGFDDGGFREFYDTMWVKKADEIPKNLSEYKGIKYEAYLSRLGILSIKRLFTDYVEYENVYRVYIGDIEIVRFEHLEDGVANQPDFEELIDMIYRRKLYLEAEDKDSLFEVEYDVKIEDIKVAKLAKKTADKYAEKKLGVFLSDYASSKVYFDNTKSVWKICYFYGPYESDIFDGEFDVEVSLNGKKVVTHYGQG